MPKEIEVCAGEGGDMEGGSNDGRSSELGCPPRALPDTRYLDRMASDKNQVQLV